MTATASAPMSAAWLASAECPLSSGRRRARRATPDTAVRKASAALRRSSIESRTPSPVVPHAKTPSAPCDSRKDDVRPDGRLIERRAVIGERGHGGDDEGPAREIGELFHDPRMVAAQTEAPRPGSRGLRSARFGSARAQAVQARVVGTVGPRGLADELAVADRRRMGCRLSAAASGAWCADGRRSIGPGARCPRRVRGPPPGRGPG